MIDRSRRGSQGRGGERNGFLRCNPAPEGYSTEEWNRHSWENEPETLEDVKTAYNALHADVEKVRNKDRGSFKNHETQKLYDEILDDLIALLHKHPAEMNTVKDQ